MTKLLAMAAITLALSPFAAFAASDGIVKGPTAGCVRKAPMVRAHELREQDDPVAAQTLIDQGLRAGDCRWFAPGIQVVVEDGDILAGLSKVHVFGDPVAFWMPEDAIAFR